MFENPIVILCLVGMCWPGPIPLVLLVYVFNRWSFRIDVAPKNGNANGSGPDRSHLSDEV